MIYEPCCGDIIKVIQLINILTTRPFGQKSKGKERDADIMQRYFTVSFIRPSATFSSYYVKEYIQIHWLGTVCVRY